MKHILIAILIGISNYCFADMIESSTLKQIREGEFDKYILVRGEKLKFPIGKLEEHGELAAPRSSIFYEFQVSKSDDWTIFKLPASSSHWMFHNLTFWFLGWGEDDPNYADSVIGLAISKINRFLAT